MSTALHLVLTVLTCGLWLPIWLLMHLFPAHCSLCGNLLKRTRYVWKADGKTHHLCPHCNQQAERRKSRAAWDDPPPRPSSRRPTRRPASESSSGGSSAWKVVGVGCLTMLLVCGLLGVAGIGLAVYLQDQARKELIEADLRWEAGEQAEAVGVYRRALSGPTPLDRGREPVVYQRLIEYDLEHGSADSARQLADQALGKGVNVRSENEAVVKLLADVKADRERRAAEEQARKEAEAERKRQEREAEAKQREAEQANPPYKFLKSKREKTDVMDLYVRSGPLDAEKLLALCRDKKRNNSSEVFYLLVVFDSEDSARFPDNPFTAEYGDERDLRHIKAIYVHNKKNGFSELKYHNDGLWDTRPTREKP